MDLTALFQTFPPETAATAPAKTSLKAIPTEVHEIVSELGGITIGGGIYRCASAALVPVWTEWATTAFPEHSGTIAVFAMDWLGRAFATDTTRLTLGQPQVLMLDLGGNEALQIPCTIEEFHTTELLEAPDAALAQPFYDEWRQSSADDAVLALTECVGYRKPLWLGGSDDISNLERGDTDVYWSILTQLKEQVAHRPATGPATTSDATKKRGLFRKKS